MELRDARRSVLCGPLAPGLGQESQSRKRQPVALHRPGMQRPGESWR